MTTGATDLPGEPCRRRPRRRSSRHLSGAIEDALRERHPIPIRCKSPALDVRPSAGTPAPPAPPDDLGVGSSREASTRRPCCTPVRVRHERKTSRPWHAVGTCSASRVPNGDSSGPRSHCVADAPPGCASAICDRPPRSSLRVTSSPTVSTTPGPPVSSRRRARTSRSRDDRGRRPTRDRVAIFADVHVLAGTDGAAA
jgi:hypothetical protein